MSEAGTVSNLLDVHHRRSRMVTQVTQVSLTSRTVIGTDQMPRASGQSRAIPAQVNRGDTGLSNRKWS